MNGGSANGDAFVDWRTKCTAVLNYYIYIPSLKAHACARDPTTIFDAYKLKIFEIDKGIQSTIKIDLFVSK
jgi:hypothetical protein